MKFHISIDDGKRIAGYVVPDNPAGVSRVALSIDGRRVAVVDASLLDKFIQSRGWHSTGLCRFMIDETVWPGLAEADRLELHDAETNLLIHRRVPAADRFIDQRVALISTSIEPETAVQAALFPHFKYCYFGVHGLSEENFDVVLKNKDVTSMAISGAFLVPRFESYVFREDNTLTMMLLHDPFVEMARRMLWLWRRADVASDPRQRWRVGDLAEAATYMGGWELTNAKSVKRLLRDAPESIFQLLCNPLTRQLATRSAEDRVGPVTSIFAVERLARTHIVGHHDHFAAFMSSVFDRLGIEAEIPSAPPVSQELRALAEILSKLPLARDMLHFDVIIAEGVSRSVAKSWSEGD